MAKGADTQEELILKIERRRYHLMKKYFLDKKYKKFRIRVFIVLSIVGIIAAFIFGDEEELLPVIFLAIVFIWVSYFAIKWILKALPTNSD